ncbi:MAG: protein translocase subunit SecD [Acidimicrobiia bacterium]|nr:protein translocase subunit SecD [Acidimicrobiia bacterium]
MRRRLLSVLIVLGVAWGGVAAATAAGITPLLGLDLEGGVEALLTAPEGTEQDVLEVAVRVMRDRIEGIGNVQEPEITIVGSRNVLVQLPGVENLEDALKVLGTTGQLSFRPVYDQRFGDGTLLSEVYGACPTVPNPERPDTAGPEPVVDPATGLTPEDDPSLSSWLAEYDDEGEIVGEYLVGPAQLYGTDISDSLPQFIGTSSSGWSVSLVLTNDGEDKFASLTADAAGCLPTGTLGSPGHPGRQIAIVLDGKVLTAPPVAAEIDPRVGITGGQASIGIGNDTQAQKEAEELSIVLRYGALPIAMEQSNVEKVSATLGADSLRSGIVAGLIGLALVAVALIAYYRSLGLVAIVGLTVFGSLLVLSYSLFGRFNGLSLTLAGVVGIIVSVGITADSYIVYFERIKEELRHGVEMEEAVVHGFQRAFRTILTADFVSLMGATLLYTLAVDRVKGFALALGIATVLDIIVARYYTKNAVGLISDGRMGEGGFLSIRGFAGRQEVEA